jgi:RNA polymerase sigma-70 factor (ECF subfamily)
MAHELCAEALRLATLLTEHRATATGEAHALAALIAFHHARAGARSGEAGEMLLLSEQDRSKWDRPLIARGFAHLAAATSADTLSALHLEAAIAAAHASAPSFAATDWSAVAHCYCQLEEIKPTPVVRLNAAIAAAYADGPAVGLARLDALADAGKLARYALYHSARGALLLRLDRRNEAAEAIDRALACPLSAPERTHLERRRRDCRA